MHSGYPQKGGTPAELITEDRNYPGPELIGGGIKCLIEIRADFIDAREVSIREVSRLREQRRKKA